MTDAATAEAAAAVDGTIGTVGIPSGANEPTLVRLLGSGAAGAAPLLRLSTAADGTFGGFTSSHHSDWFRDAVLPGRCSRPFPVHFPFVSSQFYFVHSLSRLVFTPPAALTRLSHLSPTTRCAICVFFSFSFFPTIIGQLSITARLRNTSENFHRVEP